MLVVGARRGGCHDESGRAGAVAHRFAPRNHHTSEAAAAAAGSSVSAKKGFLRAREKKKRGVRPSARGKKGRWGKRWRTRITAGVLGPRPLSPSMVGFLVVSLVINGN